MNNSAYYVFSSTKPASAGTFADKIRVRRYFSDFRVLKAFRIRRKFSGAIGVEISQPELKNQGQRSEI